MAKKSDTGGGLQELKQALKNKNLGRLYFFHGEETFLLHHYLGQMKKQLLDPLTESFNFHRLDNETFDIRSFADAVHPLWREAVGAAAHGRHISHLADSWKGAHQVVY